MSTEARLRYQPVHPGMDKFHVENIPDMTQHLTVHRFTDTDFSEPHDHPWDFWSCVVQGSYIEQVFDPRAGFIGRTHRLEKTFFRVASTHIHRIVGLPDGPCITTIMPIHDSFHQAWGRWRWDDGRVQRSVWGEGGFGPWADVF
jgi:hypothetical protein